MTAPQTVELLARYLTVLGATSIRHLPATTATLMLLHRAHVLQFAHDTVWMSRQRVTPFSYGAMVKSLLRGEGGACFQLNGSFAWLLRSLGFEVSLHRSRVQNAFDAAPGPPVDAHLVLRVETPDGPYLADVGLGAGLLDPLPLRPGAVEQGGYAYELSPATEPGLDWRLAIDRKLLGIRRTEWEAEPVPLAALESAHLRDATEETSPFLQNISAHIRTETGSVVLNGRTLTTVSDRRRSMTTLDTAAEWEQSLRSVFHLALPQWSLAERDRLWEKTGGEVDVPDDALAC